MSRKRNRTRNVSPRSPVTVADIKAQEVQNEIAMDSFANPAANLGWGAENLIEGTEYPLTRLTENYMLMLSLYRSSGILKRIVNKPVEDAVAHWFKIDSQITPDQTDAFNRLQRRAKIKANIEKGLKWGRLFGGAAGLIMIDGQGDILDQPLDLDMVAPDSFKGIYIVDRWSGLYPDAHLVEDIGSPAFGLPEFYHIRENENATSDVKVHYSRILRFTGDELPYWEKQVEQMWGTSVIETIWDSLRRYDNALGNIAQLIWQANIWTHKMQGANNLFGVGATQMQSNVINSIHAQRVLMNSFGERILDSEDDLQNHPYSFAGLDRVFSIFQYDMSSVSGIPITILFGRSAAGLDATGEGDLDNYYTMLEEIQENDIRPVLEQLVPIMCMSEFGAVPDDIDLSFNPVRVPTEKEKAEIATSKTNAVVQAHSEGIINDQIAMKELRSMSDSTGMFTNITDEDVKNADQKPDIGDIPPGPGDEPRVGRTEAQDSGFDESKHPRRPDGKFGTGVGNHVDREGEEYYTNIAKRIDALKRKGVINPSIGIPGKAIPVKISSVNYHALKHGVTLKEAQQFIDNARIMFDQGNRNLYVSPDGNSVVLMENKRLIAAYRKDEFDDSTKAIVEAIYND